MKKFILVYVLVAIAVTALSLLLRGVISDVDLIDFTQKLEWNKDKESEVPLVKTRKAVKVFFKNGDVVDGTLIKESEESYLIEWDNQEFWFDKLLIEKIETPESGGFWDFHNNVVVKLKNGSLIDRPISAVKGDHIFLSQVFEEGGSMEMEFDSEDIENILFKPVLNDESMEIEGVLSQNFPHMKFYKEGYMTLVTDSNEIGNINRFKTTLRNASMQTYFQFFPLLKTREPTRQNYIVVFDKHEDFLKHADKQGISGAGLMGYYHSGEKIIYLFNVYGRNFTKVLNDSIGRGYENESRRNKKKINRITNRIAGMLDGLTHTTLRHEFTHGLMSNWKLQSFDSGKIKGGKSKPQNNFYENNVSQKDWLEGLINNNRNRTGLLLTEDSSSWLVEGLATYCETEPIGAQNDTWLYLMQKMIRQNKVYSLKAFTNFSNGSFSEMNSDDDVLNAYAQSWALTTFLMKEHAQPFFDYIANVSDPSSEKRDHFDALLKSLDKNGATLKIELIEFIQNNYEEIIDPSMDEYLSLMDIAKEY